MTRKANQLAAAQATYSGHMTRPEKWDAWTPNRGDVIVCTPAKCGTTWTQTMILMLLYGTTDLPGRTSGLSPWVDSVLSDADSPDTVNVSPSGRRVVKTHTPADGFPVWEDVTVVCVYRHPLDVFLSFRKHVMNRKEADNPRMCGPVEDAVRYYIDGVFRNDAVDDDYLSTVVEHYRRSRARGHTDQQVFLHYSDIIADHRGTVRMLADRLNIGCTDAFADAVTRATVIDAMRAEPARFAPEGGKGFWHDDAAFFDTGGTQKWQGVLDSGDIEAFGTALAGMLPDPADRSWITSGRRDA